MKRSSSSGGSGRRRSRAVASAILAGCIVYIANTILYPPSTNYDHYVPGHRFLQVDGDQSNHKISLGQLQHKTTLNLRSEEDAAAVRKRSLQAGRKRQLRLLASDRNANLNDEGLSLSGEVLRSVLATANALSVPPSRQLHVSPYDVDSALLANRAFHRELLFFVYDSRTDDFVVLHNLATCDWGCKRAYVVAPVLAYALRKNYPARFQGKQSKDMMFLLSMGDTPRVRRQCIFEENKYCKSDKWAPILQFGSVMSDPMYMPTAIPMPQSPRPHIPCIDEYQTTGNVCQDLRPQVADVTSKASAAAADGDKVLQSGKHFKHGLVFGKEFGLLRPNYWDNLVPQVIWRGSDFSFLHTLFPDMRAPTYEEDIKPREAEFGDDVARDAIKALWDMGQDKLTPRWQGVLLTSEAELEARELGGGGPPALPGLNGPALPWVNIKFASVNVGGEKVPASDNEGLRLLQDKFGISAIGDSMNMMEHAQYKYQIDLGGGGGTTWTGTIEKLALPGVLFHHVTPTKDWFHDHLDPWVHYIPIATDLSDLREKYDWAESHPTEAQRIAEAGTEFARWMGSQEGFEQLYQEHFVAPLGKIIASYELPRKKYHGKKVLDILREEGNGSFGVVARCGGWPAESSECRWTKKDNDQAAIA